MFTMVVRGCRGGLQGMQHNYKSGTWAHGARVVQSVSEILGRETPLKRPLKVDHDRQAPQTNKHVCLQCGKRM